MNQIDKKKIIKEAKRKFVKHKLLSVHVKKNASVPYEKSFFNKFIDDSKNPKLNHKKYVIYIHDKYLTIRSETHLFEPVKVLLDDKIWIELYSVFKIDGIIEDDDLTRKLDAESI